VHAQREGTGGPGPWADRKHAEDEASGDRAGTEDLCNLPRQRETANSCYPSAASKLSQRDAWRRQLSQTGYSSLP
jgi:hypothetical protein